MKLTDDERRIADDMAKYWAYTLDSLDAAWERAMQFIAARRKALGEPEAAPAKPAGGDEPRAEAVGDSAGPANQSPPTTARDCSAAHWCRLNGWGVGTILEGDEGRGPERIVITAIGEENILAKPIVGPHGDDSWVLWGRDWKRVGWQPRGPYLTMRVGQGDDGELRARTEWRQHPAPLRVEWLT